VDVDAPEEAFQQICKKIPTTRGATMTISDEVISLVNHTRYSLNSLAPEMEYLAEHPRKIAADEYSPAPRLSNEPDLCYSVSRISTPCINDSDSSEIMARMAA